MSTANLRLGTDELRVLRDLAMGRPAHLSSNHRLRLELIGLLKDGPEGPKLTPFAIRYLQLHQAASAISPESALPDKLDRAGRRMPFRRSLPFV